MTPDFPERPVLLCATRGGPTLVFAADRVIGNALRTSGTFGEYKIDEVAAFVAAACPDQPLDCFADFGANIGTHVMHALGSGRFARAVAVEADPDNFLLLTANVAMRGQTARVRLIQCALSDRAGTVELELCDNNFGDHRVRVSGVAQQRDFGECRRVTRTVPAETVDALFAPGEPDWSRTLVWIDTQGHEAHVLAGASRSFTCVLPALVMEFWPYGLERAGGQASYFDCLRRCEAVYDINRPAWQTKGRVEVAELTALYDTMLDDTRADQYPHTDLLCLRPGART